MRKLIRRMCLSWLISVFLASLVLLYTVFLPVTISFGEIAIIATILHIYYFEKLRRED